MNIPIDSNPKIEFTIIVGIVDHIRKQTKIHFFFFLYSKLLCFTHQLNGRWIAMRFGNCGTIKSMECSLSLPQWFQGTIQSIHLREAKKQTCSIPQHKMELNSDYIFSFHCAIILFYIFSLGVFWYVRLETFHIISTRHSDVYWP